MTSEEIERTHTLLKEHGILVSRGHSIISLNTDLGPYVCVKCRQQRNKCGSFNHQSCPSDFSGTMGQNLLAKQILDRPYVN